MPRLAAARPILAAGARAETAPARQRAGWMGGFDCPRGSPADRAWPTAQQGQEVVFGPAAFTNRLYEDCPRGVDYAELRLRPAAEARAFLLHESGAVLRLE